MRERQVKNVTSNRDNTTRRTHAEDIPRGWKRENSGSWSANGNRSRRKASVRKLLVDFPYPPTYLEVTYPLATLPSPLPTLSLSLCNFLFLFCLFVAASPSWKKSLTSRKADRAVLFGLFGFFYYRMFVALEERVLHAQCVCVRAVGIVRVVYRLFEERERESVCFGYAWR